MAEVDFGDSELFGQLDESFPSRPRVRSEEEVQGPEELRDRLRECQETVGGLMAENQELKRKLNILTRPGGINIENSRLDGPLLQILFANNDLSKQCRQEIEDYIFSLIKKHEQQGKDEKEKASFHAKPQPSSFVLEECDQVNSSGIRKIKDAFTVVGSVLYFSGFCLDKLGQPLLNENPHLTEGWDIPKYQQIFGQVISLDGQEMQIKEKRPKSCCFNCGSEDHQLKDCTKPRDMNRINEKRKEFSQGNTQSNQRYHEEEVEERFRKYKPGIVSVELLDALGVAENSLPPFIYRMRHLGYPPGWLKEAEMENSGLTLYDGKAFSDGELAEEEYYQRPRISYDVSKLVEFPGFNVSLPANVIDDWKSYGSIPMQSTHMLQNFAADLSQSFPKPGSNCSKRSHEIDSASRRSKKRRSDVDRSSDMDVDSGSEIRSSDNFQFQPPLPPGSPGLDTPPPLPRGTPPATPPPLPRSTPPATPTSRGSPALRGQAGSGTEDLTGEEDGLTLEELEEQQRLIWAALASADTANNSDSETPVISSSSASTPAQFDLEMESIEVEKQLIASDVKDLSSPVPSDDVLMSNDKTDMDDCSTEVKMQGEVHSGTEAVHGEPPLQMEAFDSWPKEVAGSTGKVMSVPHRSKFAVGIIPFEDTPEYRDVAKATGVYLRIRDLLKGSPRNQTKNKK